MKTLVKLPYILGLSTLFVTSISCEEKRLLRKRKPLSKPDLSNFTITR